MQHFERKWVSIHLVFFGLSYPNVSLSFPRLKAQELVGWWFCSPLTSTSWERKKIMTNLCVLCVANILSTWKVEKSGKMCDVLKVNRLKSCLECFCFPVVSPFFLQYCSFGQKSIISPFRSAAGSSAEDAHFSPDSSSTAAYSRANHRGVGWGWKWAMRISERCSFTEGFFGQVSTTWLSMSPKWHTRLLELKIYRYTFHLHLRFYTVKSWLYTYTTNNTHLFVS